MQAALHCGHGVLSREAAALLVFFSTLFLNAESFDQKFYAAQSDDIYRKIVEKSRDGGLSTMPFCYTAESESRSSDFSLRSNISWPEYLEMAKNTGVFNVTASFLLLQIVDIEEKSQTIQMIIYILTSWYDCRLGWIPEDYGNFNYTLSIDPEVYNDLKIYRPSLEIMQSINLKDADDSERHFKINPNGLVTMHQEYLTTISCSFDINIYPFDVQTCALSFQSEASSDLSRLQWRHANLIGNAKELSEIILGRYTRHDQWAVTVLPPVLEQEKTCKGNMSQKSCFIDVLHFRMLLRRSPRSLLTNLFLPAFLLVLISAFIFIIPPDSSDKMALNLANLLAMYMFSQSLYSQTPETGSTVPLLSLFFMICTGLSSASCLYAAVSAMMSNAQLPVPCCLRKFTLAMGRVLLCDVISSSCCSTLKKRTEQKQKQKPQQRTNPKGKEHGDNQCDQDYTFLNQHNSNNNPDTPVESYNEDADIDSITWQTVVALFDRLFFITHVLITLAAVTYFFVDGYGHWANYGGYGTDRSVMEHVCTQARTQDDPNADSICSTLD